MFLTMNHLCSALLMMRDCASSLSLSTHARAYSINLSNSLSIFFFSLFSFYLSFFSFYFFFSPCGFLSFPSISLSFFLSFFLSLSLSLSLFLSFFLSFSLSLFLPLFSEDEEDFETIG